MSNNKIEEQAELRGQVREILDAHGTFYIRATRKAILSGSDEDIAAVLNENNADQSSLERIMGILAKQKESLEKEAIETERNRHRSTLRIVSLFFDRVPEMYKAELGHRLRAFDVEVPNYEIDKEKLGEMLDDAFAHLSSKETKEE